MKYIHLTTFLILVLIMACQNKKDTVSQENSRIELVPEPDKQIRLEQEKNQESNLTSFDRAAIKKRLKAKNGNGEPYFVHIFVPLCDNENQGIVPTSKSLGDGLSLRTNLYWATKGGMKRHFNDSKDWKLVYSAKDVSSSVLERVIFERDFSGTQVYVIADAYRGDRMEETVNDFLASLAYEKKGEVELESGKTVKFGGHSDLMVFNGHNGMMDNIDVRNWKNKTEKKTDAVINACVSYNYFEEELMLAQAYPLIRTNTLLYPAAYSIEQVIIDWINDTTEKQIALNAGRVYCEKHDCGRGTKVFKTGWRE